MMKKLNTLNHQDNPPLRQIVFCVSDFQTLISSSVFSALTLSFSKILLRGFGKSHANKVTINVAARRNREMESVIQNII